MTRKLRSETIDPTVTCLVHIWCRCAQRLFLLASEQDACKHYAVALLKRLHENFAIEVINHNVMDNHFHLVVRIDPEAVKDLTDRQVVELWGLAHPPSGRPPTDAWIDRRLEDPAWVDARRARLADVSYFMKSFKQCLTQWINHWLGTTGTAWEGRFGARPLETPEDLLSTAAYVDLNPVVAGLCQWPEDALFSSAHERFAKLQASELQGVRAPAFAGPPFLGLPPMGGAVPQEVFVSHHHRPVAREGKSHRGTPVLCAGGDREYLQLLRNLAEVIRTGCERAGHVATAATAGPTLGHCVPELAEQVMSMFHDPRWSPG